MRACALPLKCESRTRNARTAHLPLRHVTRTLRVMTDCTYPTRDQTVNAVECRAIGFTVPFGTILMDSI